MTPEEIIEGNKLIAEFMNHRHFDSIRGDEVRFWTPSKETIADCDYHNLLKYHLSWSWLMPVVEKIVHESACFKMTLGNVATICHFESSRNKIVSDSTKPIEAVWLAVVAFIKWHNQNSK